MTTGKRRILVLYWHPGPGELRVAIRRHLHAIDWSRHRHDVLYFNAVDGVPQWLRHFRFDAIILHTTLLCLRWSHLFPELKWKLRWIADVRGVKIAIPQDEYDHAWVLDDWLHELGVSVICTTFGEQHRQTLYPIMANRAAFEKCLTGYIDDADVSWAAERLKPHRERPWDLVYRASHLPYWFGKQGQLKHRIAGIFTDEAERKGLRRDISTAIEDTITGARWLEFLASGRAVIGCESGSSVLDRRGEIRARIQMLCNASPGLTFEHTGRAMPPGWDDWRFYAISPRHFEAVVTKTAQILVEGEYDGILEPGRHYVPLKGDFSNLQDVFDQLEDRPAMERMAEVAYVDLCRSGRFSYKTFAEQLDRVIDRELAGPVASNLVLESGSRLPWRTGCVLAKISERCRMTAYHWTNRFVQSSSHWWMLRHPVVCLAKLFVLIRLVWGSWLTRDMLVHYLSTQKLRKQISPYRLLGDLLTLRLLQEVRVGTASAGTESHVEVRFDDESEVLVFYTRPGLKPDEHSSPSCRHVSRSMPRPRSVVWDHSAVGRQVLYPFVASKRLAFQIGSYGTYTFETMSSLMRSLPDDVWERLSETFQAEAMQQLTKPDGVPG
ncbi:MAG TPA: hypothetical protein VFS39_01005 [Nitrospira sp.]|nr:hypothetical protein [Nitrospira sp.]